MSIQQTITSGAWQNIGTGPATVQVISPAAGTTVMVISQTAAPATNSDGLAMGAQLPIQHFSRTQILWAQVAETNLTALIAVQPEAV